MGGWDDDNAFGSSSDPFSGPSADCFGDAIEDVDPFQEGNDSFGGDKEWTTFDEDESESDDDDDDDDNDIDSRSRSQAGGRSTSSRSARDRSRSRRKGSSSNGTLRRSGHRIPPSNRQERPPSTSSSAKRTHSGSGRHGHGSSSHTTSRRSPSPVVSSNGRRREHRVESSPSRFDSFMPEDAGENPFRVGTVVSPMRHHKPTVGSSGFATFDAAFDEPALMMDSPSSARKSPSSSSGHRSQAKVIHDRHGRAQRMTTREEKSRNKHSETRRSAVKDSIFSSLRGFDGDEDEEHNAGLSAFLSEKSGRSSSGRRRGGVNGNDSVGENSTKSAPAANHGHYQQRQYRRGTTKPSSHDDTTSPRRTRHGKSLRAGRLPPSGAQRRAKSTGTSGVDSRGGAAHHHQQPLTLDVAALAEHGHLEVVDGKMRLVLDVETITR